MSGAALSGIPPRSGRRGAGIGEPDGLGWGVHLPEGPSTMSARRQSKWA